jgi:diaminopimelate decarboxylase
MKFKYFTPIAIQEAAKQFGTPLYLYDLDAIEKNIHQLKSAVGDFKLRYAVKTNPNPHLLSWMKGRVESMDVSSAGEITQVVNNGWSGDDMEFTGPAKTRIDFEIALDNKVKSIVVEDISEIILLNDVAQTRKEIARILIRIAPNAAEKKFGIRLAGRPTQFGIDEDRLESVLQQVKSLESVSLEGFHIYSGSQCLDDEALAEHFDNMWILFKKAIAWWGKPINELVFGAGMGIPYHDGDKELTLSKLPECIRNIRQEMNDVNPGIDCYIEVGRFLVGTAGLFITKVVRVKESHGAKIALCDGGMNNNLGACGHMGGISHRHYSMMNASARSEDVEQYRIVGPLCTAIDTLAHRVDLPVLQEGDLIAVGCSGSYGPTASPLLFISHHLPKEVSMNSQSDDNNFVDVSWIKL